MVMDGGNRFISPEPGSVSGTPELIYIVNNHR